MKYPNVLSFMFRLFRLVNKHFQLVKPMLQSLVDIVADLSSDMHAFFLQRFKTFPRSLKNDGGVWICWKCWHPSGFLGSVDFFRRYNVEYKLFYWLRCCYPSLPSWKLLNIYFVKQKLFKQCRRIEHFIIHMCKILRFRKIRN